MRDRLSGKILAFAIIFMMSAIALFEVIPLSTSSREYSILDYIYSTRPKLAEVPREDTFIFVGHTSKLTPPDNYNAASPGIFSIAYFTITGPMIEYLFYYSVTNGTFIPWLATGYKMDTDNAGITIYLRPNVTWNDGHPFTAEDVKFTAELLRAYPWIHNEPVVWNESLVSATVINATTVYLKMNKPIPRLVDYMTVEYLRAFLPLPKHVWEPYSANRTALESFKNYPPVFTGPYKLVDSSEDIQILDRREDYWGSKPEPKRIIVWRLDTADKQMMAMEKHEIDCVRARMTGPQLEELKKRNPYVIDWRETPPYSGPDPCLRTVQFNLYRYPTSVPEIRKAISLCINRTKAAEVAYTKLAGIPESPFITPAFPSLAKYWPNSTFAQYPYHTYNKTLAESLLTGIGCYRDATKKWRDKNGTLIQFEVLSTSTGYYRPLAESVYDDLLAFGFTASLRLVETIRTYQYNYQFDVCVDHTCPMPPFVSKDIYWYLDDFYGGRWGGIEKYPEGKSALQIHKWTRYNDPEYNNLMAALDNVTMDDPQYPQIVKSLLEIWLRDFPQAPLTYHPMWIEFDQYYWVGYPSEKNPYAMPQTWGGMFKFVIHSLRHNPDKPWVPKEKPAGFPWTETIIAAVVVIAVVGIVLVVRKRSPTQA